MDKTNNLMVELEKRLAELSGPLQHTRLQLIAEVTTYLGEMAIRSLQPDEAATEMTGYNQGIFQKKAFDLAVLLIAWLQDKPRIELPLRGE